MLRNVSLMLSNGWHDEIFDCDEFTEETCDTTEEEELHDDVNPDGEISPSSMETGTECPDSVETMEENLVPENCASEGSVTLLETNTPELEMGKTPLDLNCDSSVVVEEGHPSKLAKLFNRCKSNRVS
ncbi:hypothetical protein M8J76_004427 [Diaphorina citri]|nr:hypothetical protein M8J76_004427 [Diaphorina citri]